MRQGFKPDFVLAVIEGDEIAREDVGADESVTLIDTLPGVGFAAHDAGVVQGSDVAVFELDVSDTN